MKLFCGTISDGLVQVHDEEQQHILKVLRIQEGEEVFVTDGAGNLARGNLAFNGKKVILTQVEIYEKAPLSVQHLHIAIAPTKNIDRIEFFIEKATELGVSEISFILTEQSERRHINIDRLRKQSVAASKQSLRRYFPKINDLVKLPEFIKNIEAERTFVAHCDSVFQRESIHRIPLFGDMTVLIGPEGDFSPNEIKILVESGVQAVSLGNQRLRTETAGVFVAAWWYARMLE